MNSRYTMPCHVKQTLNSTFPFEQLCWNFMACDDTVASMQRTAVYFRGCTGNTRFCHLWWCLYCYLLYWCAHQLSQCGHWILPALELFVWYVGRCNTPSEATKRLT
jgi:hypothetical protein